MRVLLIHRHFWPDTAPYATLLRGIGRRLVAEGHRATVLSAQPSYNAAATCQPRPVREAVDGMDVVRMPLLPEPRRHTPRRTLNALLFLLQVLWRVARRRDDVVMFSTVPPVALGVVVRGALALTGRAGRYVYHCQDIHPEAAVIGGLLRPGRWYRLLRRIDTATCRKAAAVVVLSPDMRDTVVGRGVDPARVRMLNNFALVEPDAGVAPPAAVVPPHGPDDHVVAFAGNMGRFQDLHTLIDAAWLVRDDPRIQIWIVGDGIRRDALRRRAGALAGHTVHFVGHQPAPIAFGLLQLADAAVVTLRRGMHRVAFPSKTMTALMAGCRLVVTAEDDSDLARTVREAGLGEVSRPGDATALATAIREGRGRCTAAHRAHARRYALAHYAADVVCDAWASLFACVADEVGG